MSNNDLDDANFDDIGGLDDDFEYGAQGSSLGDILNSSPLAKVGLLIGAVVLIAGAVVLFGGSEKKEVNSSLRGSTAANLTEVPGEEVSQAYEDAINDYNITQVENALKTGTSALPVPVGSARGRVVLEADAQTETEDPLEKWRRIQEERQKRATAMPTMDAAKEQANPNAQQIDALTKLMQTQMQSILASQTINPLKNMGVTTDAWLIEQRRLQAEAEKALADAALVQISQQAEEALEIIIPAGTIEYAQTIIQANSDAKGPVLAEIASGPLAGSRILGQFNSTEDFLVLNFTQAVVDGVSISVKAIALDPATTSVGVVTDIDRHYFERIILPGAARFIEGMAGAIAERETNVYVVGDTALQQKPPLKTKEQIYAGVEEAASQVADVLDKDAGNKKPTVKVAAGTPIGILFLEPVIKNDQAARLVPANPAQNAAAAAAQYVSSGP
jgi:intracellular multiplication protein IcmE